MASEHMGLPALRKGAARAFCKCTMHGRVGWYDYIPYSLSVPIFVMPCGCGHGGMTRVGEEEFYSALSAA